ncbi:MAG: hypothetical protein EOP09_00375 [Proteobacteria bacterium]|nr:MAG: hypothetical protein EOP09_00375 [Pseudomonadota bacterium]
MAFDALLTGFLKLLMGGAAARFLSGKSWEFLRGVAVKELHNFELGFIGVYSDVDSGKKLKDTKSIVRVYQKGWRYEAVEYDLTSLREWHVRGLIISNGSLSGRWAEVGANAFGRGVFYLLAKSNPRRYEGKWCGVGDDQGTLVEGDYSLIPLISTIKKSVEVDGVDEKIIKERCLTLINDRGGLGHGYMSPSEFDDYWGWKGHKMCLVAFVGNKPEGVRLCDGPSDELNKEIDDLSKSASCVVDWRGNRIGKLKLVAVSCAARRNGIATQLYIHAIQILRDHYRCSGLFSLVWKKDRGNSANSAETLLKSFGFEEFGIVSKAWERQVDGVNASCPICVSKGIVSSCRCDGVIMYRPIGGDALTAKDFNESGRLRKYWKRVLFWVTGITLRDDLGD